MKAPRLDHDQGMDDNSREGAEPNPEAEMSQRLVADPADDPGAGQRPKKVLHSFRSTDIRYHDMCDLEARTSNAIVPVARTAVGGAGTVWLVTFGVGLDCQVDRFNPRDALDPCPNFLTPGLVGPQVFLSFSVPPFIFNLASVALNLKTVATTGAGAGSALGAGSAGAVGSWQLWCDSYMGGGGGGSGQ